MATEEDTCPHDEEIFEAELRRIFGQCWNFVGHVTEIPEPGDYALRYVGKDPFIFVRDENGEIRVLFDACTHHGSNTPGRDSVTCHETRSVSSARKTPVL